MEKFKQNILRIVIIAILILLCTGSFSSCDFFIAPAPFVNSQAHALENPITDTLPASLLDYRDHQIVSSTVSSVFLTDIDSSDISQINLWIDSVLAITMTKAPYAFSFNSQLWKNGDHKLIFGIYKKKKDLGLQGLLDIRVRPILYGTTLVFHHQPLAPTNVCVAGGDSHPWVFWNVTLQSDIKYYVVRRGGTVVLDTIFDPSIHGYFDYRYNYSARGVHYDVGAGNEYGISYSPLNTCYE